MKPILVMFILLLGGCSGCLQQNPVKEVIDNIDIDMSLDWVSTDTQGNEHKTPILELDDVEEMIFGPPDTSIPGE